MKPIKFLLTIGLIFGLISSIISFLVFYGNIETLGKSNEWKFYSSLIGFVIFLSMLVIVVITLIIRHKTNHNNIS